MINLIRNELVKISHKKSVLVLSIVVIGLLIFSFIIEKSFVNNGYDSVEQNYNYYKNELEFYDLNKESELRMYVGDLTFFKTYELLLDYSDDESPEYYYVFNDIQPVLNNMYYAKYISKIDDEYQLYKKQYDEMVKKLENFDWEADLLKEKREFEQQVEDLKNSENVSKKEIEVLNYEIEAIDYRLKYKIPYSYSNASSLVDEYKSSAISYLDVNKDESSYKDREELINKRELEKKLYISKYKLDHELFDDDNNETIQAIASVLSIVDFIIVIALLIICGEVVAEEFNKGTIKQLLVRPFSRNKILVSKIIASFISFLLFVLFYFILNVLYYMILDNNFGIVFSNIIEYNYFTGNVFEINLLAYSLLNFVAILPCYLCLFAFVILVGVLTTNVVGAIASGLALLFIPSFINVMLNDKIRSFLPLYCWDFTTYLFGGISSNPNSSLLKSSIVCLVFLVVVLVLAFVFFKKKDIKNQ
ncbi:MAG: ABC transporter permease subunit [Candidatus Coprovivens sp.]